MYSLEPVDGGTQLHLQVEQMYGQIVLMPPSPQAKASNISAPRPRAPARIPDWRQWSELGNELVLQPGHIHKGETSSSGRSNMPSEHSFRFRQKSNRHRVHVYPVGKVRSW